MRRSNYEIFDTFPAFERFWRSSRSLSIEEQVDRWRRDYLRPWPDLWRMQVANYERASLDWREVARTRVFPAFPRRVPIMREIRSRLLGAIPIAVRRVRDRWGVDFPVTFVIHVGIGCGAGWATDFRGTPSVLFGVENAAEVGWNDPVTTVALVEHELAHLVHAHWRRRAGLGGSERHRGTWWQLYEEGFATRCEIELGDIGVHHSRGASEDWLGWCTDHRSSLATLFLKRWATEDASRRFFGSWNDVQGHIETGYFLGSEVIRDWERRFSLHEIACWSPEQIRRRARASLRRMAASRPRPSMAAGPKRRSGERRR